MNYNKICIRDFLAKHVDLEDFCFILENKINLIYSYQNLAGGTPSLKSINLVVIADRRGELGELVFHLVYYWLENQKGSSQVLKEKGLQNDLALFRDELLERGDRQMAAEVDQLLSQIAPGYNSTKSHKPGLGEDRTRAKEVSELVNKDKLGLDRRTVFICYSREDEKQKEELLTHLGVLVYANLIEIWSDDRIAPGYDWKAEINKAMNRAQVAILLISANFLTSESIQKWEIPALLERQKKGDLIIFPVIAKPCPLKPVTWLSNMQVRPKAGNPIWGGANSRVDSDLAEIAEEIADIVAKKNNKGN